jgi:hypothetical protein
MKYKRNDSVIYEILQGEAVLLAPYSELYFSLNTTAVFLWKSLPCDVSDLAECFAKKFHQELESAKVEVDEFFQEMENFSLVEKEES